MRIRLGKKENGFAVVIIFVLLSVMGVYLVGNAISLNTLKRDLANIEKAQKRYLEKLATKTRRPTPENNG